MACDAEELPFEDESFDLVLGHAVLHHIPHLDRAFAELRRVLGRAGGSSSPASRRGPATGIAAYPKRRRRCAPRRCGAGVHARPRAAAPGSHGDGGHGDLDGEALEPFVDVHAFTPEELSARGARRGLRRTCASAARSCSRTGSAG